MKLREAMTSRNKLPDLTSETVHQIKARTSRFVLVFGGFFSRETGFGLNYADSCK